MSNLKDPAKLLDLLDQLTDEVAEPVFQAEPQEPAPEPETEPKPATPPANEPEARTEGPVDSDSIANAIIGFTSNVFEIGGKRLYPSFILEEGDPALLNDLQRKIRMAAPVDPKETLEAETAANPGLVDVLLRWEKCDEAVKGAPFTEEEKKLLREPLSKVIEKYKFLQLGPELILFMCLAMVMTPRITPLFPGFSGFLSDTLKRSKSE